MIIESRGSGYSDRFADRAVARMTLCTGRSDIVAFRRSAVRFQAAMILEVSHDRGIHWFNDNVRTTRNDTRRQLAATHAAERSFGEHGGYFQRLTEGSVLAAKVEVNWC